MFYIESVEIDGFWGKHKASTSLRSDVNIFIGRNGTGKTTFMNLLEAVLRADLKMLGILEFDKITIKLRDKTKRKTLAVSKKFISVSGHDELRYRFIVFKIGQKSFELPYNTEGYTRPFRVNNVTRREHDDIKRQLDGFLNISSLSVHRSIGEVKREEYVDRAHIQQSPIDQRLQDLMQRLTSYQLTLAEGASKVSSHFQSEVLASMLYNEDFDTWNVNEGFDFELKKEKDELSGAYKELGAFSSQIAKKIDEHIGALNRSLSSVNKGEGLSINDIMPLPLLRRTQYIIGLSRKAEKEKQEIFKPIRQFENIIREFITDKEIRIASSGELTIQKDNKLIPVEDLSSGEKQLLILLAETLLQRNQAFVFLADEPELSLHISWQAKIISSIRQLNSHAQVIVATHSPEVAGEWSSGIIDMEDIIHAKS